MPANPTELTFEIELLLGERLTFPSDAGASIGPGHWLVTIRLAEATATNEPVRGHSAFLNAYPPEDEGLYDDYPAR